MTAPTRLRAVLFDMDGVLVQSYHAWFALMNALARELGCAPITKEAFHPTWGQGPEADAASFFGGCPVSRVQAWYDARLEDYAGEVRVDPDGPPLFARLKAAGLAVAVVTNTTGRAARAMLTRAGLCPDELVGADAVPRAKPAPDMVLEACRRLGVEPAQAVMIGDSDFDLQAAMGAEVDFIPYRRGEGSLTELAQLPARLGLIS